ncbi:hypothetical protein RJG79_04970 [Mycoplasmatota bacterium WC44]
MKKELEELFELYNRQLALNQNLLEEIVNKEVDPNDEHGTLQGLSKQSEKLMNFKNNPKDKEEYPRPDVGILYSLKREDTKNDFVKILSEREEFIDKTFTFFTIEDIEMRDELIYGFYIDSKHEMSEKPTRFPKLIYNLALHSRGSSVRKMRKLRVNDEIELINPVNWFRQDILFDMLSSLSIGEKYLLPYDTLSEKVLEEFLSKYKYLYIVPRRDYKHPEIITIKRLNDKEVLLSIGKNHQQIPRKDIYLNIQKVIRGARYNVYKGIPSLKWNGMPAECRVYVQKDINGIWKVSAKLIKNELFASGSLYRNSVKKIEDFFVEYINDINTEIKDMLERVPIDFATYLDFYIPDVGSYTFDFVIKSKDSIYLIYIGGFEQYDYISLNSKKSWNSYMNYVFDLIQYRLIRCDKNEKLMD